MNLISYRNVKMYKYKNEYICTNIILPWSTLKSNYRIGVTQCVELGDHPPICYSTLPPGLHTWVVFLSTTPIHSVPMPPRLVSTEEVARHDSPDDCWLVIDNQVWDVSSFAPDHPGGAESMSYP